MPTLNAAAKAIGDLLRRVNAALDGVREDGFDEFTLAVRTLTDLEDQVQCLTALRPIRALREPLLDVAASLSLTATSLLEALDAGTIQEAQRHANTVQPAIDMATEALATLRFVSNPNAPYEVLLSNGVTNLAEWAVANGLHEFAALSVPTRNAFAHNDWRIDSGDVVLCELRPPAGGAIRVTADELNDHALAIEEATLATYLGIVVALVAHDHELPNDGRLISTAAGPIASAVLAAQGWSELTIEWPTDDTVAMSGARDVGSVLHFAALGYLFPSASRFEILARTRSGERTVSLDLQALRIWSNEQPDATKLISFAEFLHKSTVDSAPIASKSELRRTVAAVTSKWITERDDHRGVVEVFKKGRQVAEACGDAELLAALRTAQGWRYSRLQGFHRPVSEIEQYLDWGQQVPNIDPEF